MNFNVYLEDSLGEQLNQYLKKEKKSRNAVIREALQSWLNKGKVAKGWPKEVINFKGEPGFPTKEELREGLLPPREDEIL